MGLKRGQKNEWMNDNIVNFPCLGWIQSTSLVKLHSFKTAPGALLIINALQWQQTDFLAPPPASRSAPERRPAPRFSPGGPAPALQPGSGPGPALRRRHRCQGKTWTEGTRRTGTRMRTEERRSPPGWGRGDWLSSEWTSWTGSVCKHHSGSRRTVGRRFARSKLFPLLSVWSGVNDLLPIFRPIHGSSLSALSSVRSPLRRCRWGWNKDPVNCKPAW